MVDSMQRQLLAFFSCREAYPGFNDEMVQCTECGTFLGKRVVQTRLCLGAKGLCSTVFPDAIAIVIVHPIEGQVPSSFLYLERPNHTYILKSAIPKDNNICQFLSKIFPKEREPIERYRLINKDLQELISLGSPIYKFRLDELIDEMAKIMHRKWPDTNSVAFIKKEMVSKLVHVMCNSIQERVDQNFTPE
jgi:hypothetical protein